MIKRIFAFAISFCLIFEQTGFAQVAGQMQVPGYLANLLPADNFSPVQLRSVIYNPTQDSFRLMLDKGDEKTKQLDATAGELWNYFQIGLRLPNTMFWVNLRPDSPQNVIDPYLEKTDLGRILLAADLQLKKDMAKSTSPDTAQGRQYWTKLYAKAEQLYGQGDMEVPTLTRPWIVPGEVIIKETATGAYIYKATLNVMLEQDYLKDSPFYNITDPKQKEMNAYSSELIRKDILPGLVREVNSAKRYAQLRQVYYSVVLAQWFKAKMQGRQGEMASKIDSKDLAGLTSQKSWSKDSYYEAYKKSFSQGEYNKEEEVRIGSNIVVRNYFSGGAELIVPAGAVTTISSNQNIAATDRTYDILPDGKIIAETPGPAESAGGISQNRRQEIEKLLNERIKEMGWSAPLVQLQARIWSGDLIRKINAVIAEEEALLRMVQRTDQGGPGPEAFQQRRIGEWKNMLAELQRKDGGDKEVIKELLRDKEFAEEMAVYLNDKYNETQPADQRYPLYGEKDVTAPSGTTKKDIAIAMNLAGFYALETAVGALQEMPNRQGQSIGQIMIDIAEGRLSDREKNLVMRFANATWKAGQPFRDINRITRGAFTLWDELPQTEKDKDWVQIQNAAKKTLEKMSAGKDREILKQLLQDRMFAEEMAVYLNDKYNETQPADQRYPLYGEKDVTAPSGTTKKDIAIAMNLAGFYALETAVGALQEMPNRQGQSIGQIMIDIAEGRLSDREKNLVMRFANATWKAGQPFRDINRITRGAFTLWDELPQTEKDKDWVQIQNAAKKTLEKMSAGKDGGDLTLGELLGEMSQYLKTLTRSGKVAGLTIYQAFGYYGNSSENIRRLLGVELVDGYISTNIAVLRSSQHDAFRDKCAEVAYKLDISDSEFAAIRRGDRDTIIQIVNRMADRLAAEQRDGEGNQESKPGGIDFRAVPMLTQPGLGVNAPQVDMKQLQLLAEKSNIKDLDREWVAIQKQMKGKQMPYAKMKEYIAVCSRNKDDSR
ncbi:MAG TPA: hypothetical protein PLJ26_03690, partial [Candidatus Omnitrophota bacterium]|nr:hypothetical protein [Candidatus Omnitrophota bacterium]